MPTLAAAAAALSERTLPAAALAGRRACRGPHWRSRWLPAAGTLAPARAPRRRRGRHARAPRRPPCLHPLASRAPAFPCAYTRWRRCCTTRRVLLAWANERGPPTAPAASWRGTPTCSTTRRHAMRSAGTPGRSSSLTTSTGASASRSSRSGSSSPRRTPRCRRSGGRRGRCPAWRPPCLSHRAAPDEATLVDAFAAATDAVSGALSAVFAGVSAASAESTG
ncbi:hypothetical protein PVAP13_3NG141001 [Panicum virgatum]|uniref:Uncharacterized protein n=1 Tax=Panicum virgatum TaxID=38727 RepID=A0A8T0UCY2_PANVG|nr:hypothetical protein PVAP13_3NG141001 [Panicum virgatum]